MMLVTSVAFLLTRGASIYEAQVPRRVDSPAAGRAKSSSPVTTLFKRSISSTMTSLQCLGVGDVDVVDAAGVLPVGVLGADAGIVEAGGDAVHVGGLAVGRFAARFASDLAFASTRRSTAANFSSPWTRFRLIRP